MWAIFWQDIFQIEQPDRVKAVLLAFGIKHQLFASEVQFGIYFWSAWWFNNFLGFLSPQHHAHRGTAPHSVATLHATFRVILRKLITAILLFTF